VSSVQRSFTAAIKDFTKVVPARMDEIIRITARDLLWDVRSVWPVWSGWSILSWFITLDKGDAYVYEPRPPKPKQALHAVHLPDQNMPDIRWGDRIYIKNNVPYAGHTTSESGDSVGVFDRHPEAESNLKISVQRAQRTVIREAKRLCK